MRLLRSVPLGLGLLACSSVGGLGDAERFDATLAGEATSDARREAALDAPLGPEVLAVPDAEVAADADTLAESACASSCSSDQRSVLDCAGSVLRACASDERCLEGACVSACELARASDSTVGCEYYVVAPGAIEGARASCFAAFVANAGDHPLTLTLERDGVSFDVSRLARIPSGSGRALSYAPLPPEGLPAGQVAILFLSASPGALVGCPEGVTPALATDAAVHASGRGRAFHLRSSGPIVAYDIFPYGGGSAAATGATLLLPVNTWRQRYLVVNAYRQSAIAVGAMPYAAVVASEDDTTVTLTPRVAVNGGPGVEPAVAGVAHAYRLQRGEVLQWGQPAELTGSVLTADRPVGLWGGATCLNIPVSAGACDVAHQQLPPTQSLGHQYAAVRYRNRFDGVEESPPWRLVGTTDGTTLSYEPAAPLGAPTTLAAGQLAEFNAPGPFLVRSQDSGHPFYLAAYMTGSSVVSPPSGDSRGDPEFVNVVPTAQYLTRYTLFTDPTYPETSLVVVRGRASAGFAEVTLGCLGVLAGWQPLGSDYQYTRVSLVTGDFEGQGGCDNGVHTLASEAPFGVTVWGWGSAATGSSGPDGTTGIYSQAVSYAYPGGAAVRSLNGL